MEPHNNSDYSINAKSDQAIIFTNQIQSFPEWLTIFWLFLYLFDLPSTYSSSTDQIPLAVMTYLHLPDVDGDVVEFHNPACRDEHAEVEVTVRCSPIVDFRRTIFLAVVRDETVDRGIDRCILGFISVRDVCDANLHVRVDLLRADQ